MLKLFGGNLVTEAAEVPAGYVDTYMEGTEEELYEINLESATDFMAIESATFVSDALLVNAYVTEGVGRYEVLKESSKEGILDSIKNAIMKFWNSVKAWFAKVGETISIIFSGGKKLADKYGDEFMKFDFKKMITLGDGDVKILKIQESAGNNEFDRIKKLISAELSAVASKASSKSDLAAMFGGDNKKSIDGFKATLNIGDKTAAEAIKSAYDIKFEKGKLADNISTTDVIKTLKDDKFSKTLKSEQSIMDSQFKNAVNLINQAKSVANKDDSAGFVAAAKNAVTYMQQLMSMYNQIIAARISVWKKKYSYCTSFVKKILSQNGTNLGVETIGKQVRDRTRANNTKESWDFESFIGDFSL